MRIGLITDTHVPDVAKSLPAELAHVFKGVELILHAGDIYSLSVLDDLEHIAPVIAASGDDDMGPTLADPRVKAKYVLQLGGKTVWLMHERSYSYHNPNFRVGNDANDGKPDVVVFGHEHRSSVVKHNGTLWVNSGSPTFLQYCRGLGTVGILDIDSGDVRAEIIQL
ncbi:MAG: metallophosphoesterase family protein [Dehalococcoidia bacterium]|nr:metallophosphoesterase family protein [Dehalococcoidia bacterium]